MVVSVPEERSRRGKELGLSRRSYLGHPVQATQGGLEVLVLLSVEVGDLELLRGSRGHEGGLVLLDPSKA
jgi:hypothetical protein